MRPLPASERGQERPERAILSPDREITKAAHSVEPALLLAQDEGRHHRMSAYRKGEAGSGCTDTMQMDSDGLGQPPRACDDDIDVPRLRIADRHAHGVCGGTGVRFGRGSQEEGHREYPKPT